MNNIDELLYTNNWFNFQDYYDSITNNNFSTFVEVGVWKGHSISYLAKKLLEKNKIKNCKIYAVDLFDETTDFNILKDSNARNEIKDINFIYQKILEITGTREYIKDIKGYSWEAASYFENDSIDFCFIDADHTYDCILKDIKAWLPKVKNGGIISGHDYSSNHPGVIKAVNEVFNNKNIYSNTVWEVIKS